MKARGEEITERSVNDRTCQNGDFSLTGVLYWDCNKNKPLFVNIQPYNFELTKKRSRRYPAKTITDADYADDKAILANTPNLAEILLHSLQQAAAGIGHHVKAQKTEYMCFNTGDISTQDRSSLKLVEKFTYQGSRVSSTEKKHQHTANEDMDSNR